MNKFLILILSLLAAANLFPILASDEAFATECEKLTPLQCLESVRCTLDCERKTGDSKRCAKHGDYHCRRESEPCESGKSQRDLDRASCEADPACAYQPPNCFCLCQFTGECDCACGGGPPANCILKP